MLPVQLDSHTLPCLKAILSSWQTVLLLVPFPSLTLPNVRFAVSLVNVSPLVLNHLVTVSTVKPLLKDHHCTVLEQLPSLLADVELFYSHPSLTTECMLLVLVHFPLLSCSLMSLHHCSCLLLPIHVLLRLSPVTCLEAIILLFLTPSTHDIRRVLMCPMTWSDFSLPWSDFLTSPSCSGTTSPSSWLD